MRKRSVRFLPGYHVNLLLYFFSTGLISNVTLFDGQINALDASNANKIRLKVVLPLNHMNKDLYDSSCVDVPLEMMPYLLEMLQ